MGRSYQPAALAAESTPAIGATAASAIRSASRPTRQAADRPAACLRKVLLVLSMESPKNGNVGLYAGRLPFGSDLLRTSDYTQEGFHSGATYCVVEGGFGHRQLPPVAKALRVMPIVHWRIKLNRIKSKVCLRTVFSCRSQYHSPTLRRLR